MRMGKQSKRLLGWLAGITTFVTSLAIGGFFIAGGFMQVVILNLLPLVVHQVVGWSIIAMTALGAIVALSK